MTWILILSLLIDFAADEAVLVPAHPACQNTSDSFTITDGLLCLKASQVYTDTIFKGGFE